MLADNSTHPPLPWLVAQPGAFRYAPVYHLLPKRQRSAFKSQFPSSRGEPTYEFALAPVPTLDDIARNPGCARGLPQSTVKDLLRRCAVAQSILVVELDTGDLDVNLTAAQSAAAEPDRMLTVKEASAQLRRSPRWLYRHRKNLPFIRPLSPRSFLCSERGIRQWLDRRARLNS